MKIPLRKCRGFFCGILWFVKILFISLWTTLVLLDSLLDAYLPNFIYRLPARYIWKKFTGLPRNLSDFLQITATYIIGSFFLTGIGRDMRPPPDERPDDMP